MRAAQPAPIDVAAALRRWANLCLDLLFPPACASCGRAGHLFCPTCAQAVEPVDEAVCARCGRPQARAVALCADCAAGHLPYLSMVRAAAIHGEPLRTAIHQLKYENSPALAAPLARYLVAAYRLPEWRALPHPISGVTPVPLHAERRAERGYNQSELLARAFCAVVGLPLRAEWLTRVRLTQQQVGLDAAARAANVSGAFAADPAVYGQALLLIDDVFTTGATLDACAAAARQAGAVAVYGLTLALPHRN